MCVCMCVCVCVCVRACVRGHTRVCTKGVRQVVSADALTFANLGIEPRPMEDWLWEITRDHRKVIFISLFISHRPLLYLFVNAESR